MTTLTRPHTVVLRRDRHATLDPTAVLAAHGFDPASFQLLLIQHAPVGWLAWRAYSSPAPVDEAQPLTPIELAAFDRQPGISGVWRVR